VARAGARLAIALLAAGAMASGTAPAWAGRASAAGDSPEMAAAAIARACPCAGPLLGGSWRSHSEYVACAYGEVRDLARRCELRLRDAAPALRAASTGACGRRGDGTPNTGLCTAPGLVVACDVVHSAHAESCEECDAALSGDLVRCARAVDGKGTEHRDCASPASGRLPRRGRTVEVRSAVDCASCVAKLGSERPAGVACLAADCPPL
jgi:hypothetical protein